MGRWTALLLSGHGRIGRLEFLFTELVRGVGLGLCHGLHEAGFIVLAAALVPAALWPGIVGTIKRFRDLGHDPVLILPVLMYLSAGFAAGAATGVAALAVYLAYVLGVPGRR